MLNSAEESFFLKKLNNFQIQLLPFQLLTSICSHYEL